MAKNQYFLTKWVEGDEFDSNKQSESTESNSTLIIICPLPTSNQHTLYFPQKKTAKI